MASSTGMDSFDMDSVATVDREQVLRPHTPVWTQISKALPKRMWTLMACSWLVSVIVLFTVLRNTEFKDNDQNPVPAWKPIFVLNLLIAFVALVISGANPEATLMGLAALAVVCKCLKPSKLFVGASSGAVTSLALLFPIAKSLDETGWPAIIVGKFLGSPRNVSEALLRLFTIVSLLSGVFNNTPIVATMIPVLMTWCQRLNFDSRAMLIPLSFAAQVGGSLTMMGSSINFVSKQVFQAKWSMKFLDLTVGGVILSIVVGAYCVIFAPSCLKATGDRDSVSEDDKATAQEASSDGQASFVGPKAKNIYSIEMVIIPHGPLDGEPLDGTGLHRISGVHSIETLSGMEASMSNLLGGNDTVQVCATAKGIASLRRVRGLELVNENDSNMLGARRRRRRLMEAVVAESLSGRPVVASDMRHDLHCAVLSVRCREKTNWRSPDFTLTEGDVILLEADKELVGSDKWVENFGVVHVVDDSTPQRRGRKPDTLRAVAAVVGLIAVIGVAMSGEASLQLQVLCVLLLCFLIIIKAMDVKEAYKTVNAGVLLTIVGALALGDAVQDTGLAEYLASIIVKATENLGQYGVLCGLYIAAAGLGLFVTNAAVVAILGEIGMRAADQLDIPVPTVALLITYASSACWMSPYSYQTNLMVMPVGKYTWGDFLKFGVPLQVLHMVTCVLITPFCASMIGCNGCGDEARKPA